MRITFGMSDKIKPPEARCPRRLSSDGGSAIERGYAIFGYLTDLIPEGQAISNK
jgi:hypothetical protein